MRNDRCADCWRPTEVLVVVEIHAKRRELRCLEHVPHPSRR